MGRFIDLSGKRFSRWFILSGAGITGGSYYWLCQCDCGTIKKVQSTYLRNGESKSCGCLRNEDRWKTATTHGGTRNGIIIPEYRSWVAMKTRCYNKNNPAYKYYGGRGIEVCERWINSFYNFLSDMGVRPSPTHSLDRFPNKNGNYGPSNCRWATKKEQARNTRKNVFLEHNGEKLTISEWAERLNITSSSLHSKLKSRTIETIINSSRLV